jgi:hypothetical protein
MQRSTPYVRSDVDGTNITPAEAKVIIIAERYSVSKNTRKRGREQQGGLKTFSRTVEVTRQGRGHKPRLALPNHHLSPK